MHIDIIIICKIDSIMCSSHLKLNFLLDYVSSLVHTLSVSSPLTFFSSSSSSPLSLSYSSSWSSPSTTAIDQWFHQNQTKREGKRKRTRRALLFPPHFTHFLSVWIWMMVAVGWPWEWWYVRTFSSNFKPHEHTHQTDSSSV